MKSNQKYQKALDYIYSFINFSITRNLRYSEEKFDLSRMRQLMSLLGNPHFDFDVIHVTGTKGKGSTCAIIASILEEAEYKVGFYSSPHMIDLRERIKINGDEISEIELIDLLDSIKWAIEKVKDISTFEILTAMAFVYFSKKQVDIAVIEVGMGGRLDATNIVNPIISVITPISLDHTKILGDTVEKIAIEKAGIIKENIPVVISKQSDSVVKIIGKIAESMNSKMINSNAIYGWIQGDYSVFEQKFKLFSKDNPTDLEQHYYRMPLIGDHQLDNAVTAFAMIKSLPQIYKIDQKAIKNGFSNLKWPGRFEVISKKPLVIIDSAHNPDSFEKLLNTMMKYLSGEKIILIFGASEDKDIRKMISLIKPHVENIILTKSNHPRALNYDEMLSKLDYSMQKDLKFMNIEDIPGYIKNNKNMSYIASGSIFVAGAIKELMQK